MGNYTCITNNSHSVVDYAIVSEGLLPSVKYFQTHDFNYLSNHTQTELYLRCNFDTQKNDTFLNQNWSKSYTYKWDSEKSKLKLMDCLSNEQVINRIVNFETETFMEDQKGVDAATNNLTKNLNHLSENSCKIKKLSSTKIRRPQKTVMVRSISSRLKTSNQFIGNNY